MKKDKSGRHHKDYYKSDNWFNKEPKEKLSPKFIKCQKFFYWKQKQIFIVCLNKKIKIDMDLLNRLDQNYNNRIEDMCF